MRLHYPLDKPMHIHLALGQIYRPRYMQTRLASTLFSVMLTTRWYKHDGLPTQNQKVKILTLSPPLHHSLLLQLQTQRDFGSAA